MNREITWGALEHVIFFPLFLIAVGLLFYRFKRVCRVIDMLAGRWVHHLIHNFSPRKYTFKIMVATLGLLFLFLALLRPQGEKKEHVVQQEGRSVYIALDVSRSMLATDIKPNRLARAKSKITNILQLLSCERVGLILFSGSAFVQCPLTADYSAFHMFLEHVDVETISSGTTALDQAISQAINSFKSIPDQKNKLLILVTDGEDFSSNLSNIKYKAQEENLHIFTFGIGSLEGAPVPLFDQMGNAVGHQLDGNGNVVISRLNEGILSNLAHDVGGAYIQVTDDDTDIRSLLQNVQSFEKEEIGDRTVTTYQQWYPYFLFVSFICFVCEWLL